METDGPVASEATEALTEAVPPPAETSNEGDEVKDGEAEVLEGKEIKEDVEDEGEGEYEEYEDEE